MTHTIIGFIGAGNMASSLAGGMINKGLAARNIWMSDPSQEQLNAVATEHGVQVSTDNALLASKADVLVLAVKPQVMEAVCRSLAPQLATRRPLIVSIAAGVTLANLKAWLGDLPMVRCMPNTPALVQAGATGLYADESVSAEHRDISQQILSSVGLTAWFDSEAALDAVTAVSGSGPAYFFLLMESMIAAGQQLGLSADAARQLTLQTALGAAQLAITSDVGPEVLRQRVTSPGGTTAAALDVFESRAFRQIVADALAAAAQRSQELAG